MTRSRIYLALAVGLVVAATAWFGAAFAADGPTAAGDESPLRYRRILVPEDRIDEVLSGVRKYLSIKPEEFQRLIEKARPARIVEARYRARLVGETLLVGTAQLEVECPEGQQAGLSLDGCKLTIDNPHWQIEGDEKEALVGLDARGRLVAAVDRSARLTFSWSLRGTKDTSGVVRFPIQLPSSPSSHFQCDLPQGVRLQASEGVLEVGPDGRPTRKIKSDGIELWTWPIHLGSRNRLSLQVASGDVIRQRQRLTLVRQRSVYRISARGVVLTTTLNLDVHNESLRHVSLLLDPLFEHEVNKQGAKKQRGIPAQSLRLVSARYGDSDVPWSIESRGGKVSRVLLRLPAPIQGADRVLTLQATCPLPNRLGRPWRLPRIRSEKTFWQEGTAQVILSKPLFLKAASAALGRQTPSLSENSVSFEFFSPDAGLDVLIDRGHGPVEVRSGSAVEIGPARIVCRWKAQLSCRHGSHFELSADVPPRWVVDSVGPTEVIRRWQRDRATGRLVLELNRAITPTRPLSIVIDGHRASSPKALGIDEFRFVRLLGATVRRRLMAIEAEASYQLKLTGAEALARLDPQSLGQDLRLFDERLIGPPRRLLFEVGEGTERLIVAWASQSPSFDAIVSVDADLRGYLLKETYRIRCIPSDSQVARLRVRFSHARITPLRWSLSGDGATGLRATRISNVAPGNRRLSLQGDTWELTLPKAATGPFEIMATRSSSLQETLLRGVAAPLSLVSLPQASSQQAELTIRCGRPLRLQVNHERLTAIPAAPAADGRFQTVRAKFTYDPQRETTAVDAAVEISPAADPDPQPLAWVWSSLHQSRFSPQGDVEQLATFHIQNSGREQITLTLPEASTRHTVWINRQQHTPAVDGNRLTLDLPEGQKFPTVTLHYTTEGPRLDVSQWVYADLVKVDDIPELHRRWRVWVPPGYEVTSGTSSRLAGATREVTWSQRLFGLLGREANRQAFDPLDSEAWARLVRQPEQQVAARLRTNQLLRAVGTPPAGQQSWGDLLTFAQSAPSGSRPPLLIDWRALVRVGISPTTVVSRSPLAAEPSRSSANGDGSALPPAMANDDGQTSLGLRTFKAAHLVLLLHPDAIVLTTRTLAAKYRQAIIALEEECVYWVPPGRLRNRLQQAASPAGSAQSAPGASLVDLSTWKTVPTLAALPWESVEQSEGLAADHLGWTAYDFDLSGGGPPPSLRVVHRTSMRTLGYAVTILVIVAWWWLARVLEEKRRVLVWMGERVRTMGAKFRTWPTVVRWWPSRLFSAGDSASLPSHIVLPCVALGPFGAIAMLAPTGFTPITSALLLGTLVAVLLRPLARHVRAGVVTKSTDSTVSVTSPAGVAVWIATALVVGALVRNTTAQQPSGDSVGKAAPTVRSDAGATARPVPQVFVPVDDQQRAAGEVWLPKGFYDALRRREARQTGRPRQWLLRNAKYHGALHWKKGEPARLEGLRVEIELWTFVADTAVQVAIRRDLVDLTAKPALLGEDGKDSVSLRWDAGGDVATFDVRQAGRHRLIVPLRPRVDRDKAADVSQFDMAIPELASSVVEIDVPSQISSIEATSALGEVQYDKNKDRNQFTAILGATDRLKIRWSSRPLRDPTPPQYNVEQLVWLTVRPNSVMVEAKFHVKVTKGRLRTLEIDVDERLRLLPSGGSQWPIKNVTFHEGPRASIRLELDRPVHDSVDIHAKFLLTGASGVGELRQPTLDVVGATSLRRWLAVSVDPGLKFSAGTIDRTVRSIAPDDFLGKWGDQETSPQLAYQIPKPDVPWSLKTSSRSPRTTADETLIVSLRHQRARLRYSALLTSGGGAQFQYRLRVPRQMTVDRLLVQQAGVDRPTRWTDDGRGGLVVFLIGPVTGSQQLLVEGHVETPSQGKWKVPSIHVESNNVFDKGHVGVQVASRRIGVYRRPGVLVKIDGAAGLIQLKQAPALPQQQPQGTQDPGRLVAWFERKAGRENLQLSLAPNRPEVIASQLTTLEVHEEKWRVRLDFHIEQITAGSGVLDVLRFAVPDHWDDWDGSLEVSPPAAISLEKLPGETSQQLVVRPAQAIDGPFHLTVTGLTLAKDQRIELPDIVPLGLGKPRRLVMLPGTIADQQFRWKPLDLGELPIGELPPHFRAARRPRSTYTTYEVTGEQPQAIRRSAQKKSDDRLVRLMDVTVAWQTDDSCRGTVVYDLEPAGMTDVQLKMPPGYRLVAASVAGLEAGARSENETLWRIPLASAQLPQRIEVTFTGQMNSSDVYRPDFAAPRLLGVDVERTLWTVYSPPSVGVGRPSRAADQSTVLAHAQSRLRSLANLIEEEAPVVARSSPEHLAAWYHPWARRLIAARRELRRRQLTAGDGQVADGDDTDGDRDGDRDADGDFDRRQSQISPQIQSILDELSRQPPLAGDPAELWRRNFEERPIVTRCAFIGETRELSLHYAPAQRGDLAGRIAVALLMLTFSVAVVWVVRRGLSIPSPIRWVQAVAVAVGLAWWLWLSPSLLGGLIVLCAVTSAVWPLRLRASPRPWTLRAARRSV